MDLGHDVTDLWIVLGLAHDIHRCDIMLACVMWHPFGSFSAALDPRVRYRYIA